VLPGNNRSLLLPSYPVVLEKQILRSSSLSPVRGELPDPYTGSSSGMDCRHEELQGAVRGTPLYCGNNPLPERESRGVLQPAPARGRVPLGRVAIMVWRAGDMDRSGRRHKDAKFRISDRWGRYARPKKS